MTLPVLSVAFAVPSLSLGEERMTAAVLGDEKSPMPTPTARALSITSWAVAVVPSMIMDAMPAAMRAIPPVASPLDPILSERRPLRGASTTMERKIARRTSDA